MLILRNGLAIHEIDLAELKPETIIGRHPDADIPLEAQRLAMFHACLWKLDDEYYIESLAAECTTLLNRKTLKPKYPVQLRDGAVVDLPGYQLMFTLPNWPASGTSEDGAAESAEGPAVFDTPSTAPQPPCPSLSNPIVARENLCVWSEGITTLKVVNIVEETHDVKTFRLVGDEPLLFAYKPGQFVTFLLEIDGREVQRSYSMSSSPSRPHTLELTVKRVTGGLVSNWFWNQVKPGDLLRVKGPSGKFTCFQYPSEKLLFLAAGCGLTPIMSMCRWIVDTSADVDVKLLASFRSPPDIIFRREMEWMSARHNAFQIALTITGEWRGTECWTGFTGRVNRHMIALLAPDVLDRHVFMCGPEPFMENMTEILRALDFDLSHLHTESFGTARIAQGLVRNAASLAFSGPLHKVHFTRSGLTVDTDEHMTLLDLAEVHGIELDYSCRSGSCGECEVKCRGEVEISPECEIDARQRAAGFVYACSCVAKSDLEVDA
jgi:ferredoxin-NADP reductase